MKTSENEASLEFRRAPAIVAAREPSALPESCPALMLLPEKRIVDPASSQLPPSPATLYAPSWVYRIEKVYV